MAKQLLSKEAQVTYLPTVVPLNIQEISTTDYFYS